MCGQMTSSTFDMANALAEVCATITEATAPAIETATGVRDQMIADGWSREAAEHIAIEIYQTIMEMVRKGLDAASAGPVAP
jgi:hypothetical protein